MNLLRYGMPVGTVFDLLGAKEDDMTYSLGYVISRSPGFAASLLGHITGRDVAGHVEGIVKLQTVAGEHGRTDVEIHVGHEFFGILEAKRGPRLPTIRQLSKYAPLLARSTAAVKRLVAVTNAPDVHADYGLPRELNGVPVIHLSWRMIKRLAERARDDETNKNKHLLDEFATYLRGMLGMEITQSNMVYVVSVGARAAWGLSFRDVVVRQRRYFYPTEGGGWPEPPNYIAFRYDGRLQSIHHVDGFDMFTNPRTIFAEADDVTVKPHYCLRLGPPIVPGKTVPSGARIVRAMRVRCMLDTLLTCDTISDALTETKRRLGQRADEEELESPEGEGDEELA